MSLEPTPAEREQIERITSAWEEYDRTRDVEVIADFFAEDIVLMPPGQSPVIGKESVEQWLDHPEEGVEEDDDGELPQWIEDIYVSDDLAVVHAAKEGTSMPDDGGEPVEVSYKGLDEYRRDVDGAWKQLFSIWNDQA